MDVGAFQTARVGVSFAAFAVECEGAARQGGSSRKGVPARKSIPPPSPKKQDPLPGHAMTQRSPMARSGVDHLRMKRMGGASRDAAYRSGGNGRGALAPHRPPSSSLPSGTLFGEQLV